MMRGQARSSLIIWRREPYDHADRACSHVGGRPPVTGLYSPEASPEPDIKPLCRGPGDEAVQGNSDDLAEFVPAAAHGRLRHVEGCPSDILGDVMPQQIHQGRSVLML